MKPNGLEAQVVEMAFDRVLRACVTSAVLAEYADVLRRDKFLAFRERAETLIAWLHASAECFATGETVTAASDEDDNRFLECAAAAGAAFLVTGNLRHYPPEWGATRVVNARRFLDDPAVSRK